MTLMNWQRQCAGLTLVLSVVVGTASAETIKLGGNYGYEAFVARELEPGTLLDARGARFRVANSKNSNPTSDAKCDTGPLPTNPYPMRVYNSPGPVLIGGQFDGEVPLEADWEHAYCNSATVGIWDSPNVTVEGLRARRVWDAVRFSNESPMFKLQEVWLSEVRDDCVENDFLKSGLIKDVLFDGCFAGISVRPAESRTIDGTSASITLAGVLMRLQPFPYKGEVRHGALIKADNSSPMLQIYDSVFALSSEKITSKSQLEIGWSKISDCRNNVLLWQSDLPWPRELPEPPPCFQILQGERARSLWETVRQNWIDCHFSATRFSNDTQSDPLKCDQDVYGGQY